MASRSLPHATAAAIVCAIVAKIALQPRQRNKRLICLCFELGENKMRIEEPIDDDVFLKFDFKARRARTVRPAHSSNPDLHRLSTTEKFHRFEFCASLRKPHKTVDGTIYFRSTLWSPTCRQEVRCTTTESSQLKTCSKAKALSISSSCKQQTHRSSCASF
jgi:hypothetical protein